jgi:hypothetical protein
LYQNFKVQVANGDAARMALYQYDFVEGGDALNFHGKDKLARIAAMLPTNFCPIVIERLPCTPALAEARRIVVLNELAHGSFPVPGERVVVGAPIPAGLSGREGEIIYQNLLDQTRQQRQMGGQGGAGGAGRGGQGMGSSGGATGTGAGTGAGIAVGP